MELNWKVKKFDQLSLEELYRILQLRNEVFVVEQGCIYEDIDGKDMKCHHIMGVSVDGEIVAYTRIVPPGVSYDHVSIGRVLTSSQVRKEGVGKQLIQTSIETVGHFYGEVTIEIGAQLYLKKFYESFGFRQVGEPYLEAGIVHIKMIRTVSQTKQFGE